jgi:Rrf2 family protein
MYVTARADYALRATVELAAGGAASRTVAQIAAAQNIPPRFLENILLALRHARLLDSRRGSDGGFRLARPASEISLAEILNALEGPLPSIQGVAAAELAYEGSAVALRDVWLAVSANLVAVLEHITLAEVASGALPPSIGELLAQAQGHATEPRQLPAARAWLLPPREVRFLGR